MELHPAHIARFVLLLVLALALRLAAGWWWQSDLGDPQAFGFGDSTSYWELARSIAAGEPYQYGSADARVFRTPGYPILLAPIFLVAGAEPPVMWGRAMGAFWGTLSVAGCWWLGRRLFGDRAGWIAALIAALYPEEIAASILVLSESPFCPLMLLQLALWTVAWQAPTPGRAGVFALVAGVAAGAATLVRPSWLLFTPAAIAVGLAFGRPRKRHLGLGLALLAGLAMTMTPWWLRSAQLTGRFVPTTLQVGASLYDGLNPRATGASNMQPGEDFQKGLRWIDQYADCPDREPFEYRLDRTLRDEALAWARSHPGRVTRLAAVKILRMWNLWPNEPSLSAWPVRVAVAMTYLPVLVLGIVGAGRAIRRGWPYVLCWIPAVYLTLLHMIFVSSIRYREPAMLGLIVLAAGVLASGEGKEERGTRNEE
jgi:4-amino-4-deoxy-L-arabinose transferase-like glycosyltransferase